MTYDQLTVDVAERIATITVNRPEKMNAMDGATMAELGRAIDQLREDDAVGGIILTGAGRAFIAGADINELAEQDRPGAERRSRTGQAVFSRYERSPKPVIAAVNGFALGGGCELAMACHMRIAAEGAKFGQPEVKLGTLPGYGGTQRLPRLVGKGRALQLLLTGELIDAETAYRIGLVNKVVPAAELMDTALGMMRQILQNGPLAIAACIEAVNQGLDGSLADGLQLEANHFGLLASTEDMREGTSAFLAKRAPEFKGR